MEWRDGLLLGGERERKSILVEGKGVTRNSKKGGEYEGWECGEMWKGWKCELCE